MMIETQNDMPQDTRQNVFELLTERVADTIDLRYQAKQAHWNVKGPNFRSLHKLFDQVAELTDVYIDMFAERAVQLGGVIEGTIQAAVENTTLEAYPRHVLDGEEHVALIRSRLADYTAKLRHGIDHCDEWGDQATADMFTEAVRAFDEIAWMVEAHLFQGESITKIAGEIPRAMGQGDGQPRSAVAARKSSS